MEKTDLLLLEGGTQNLVMFPRIEQIVMFLKQNSNAYRISIIYIYTIFYHSITPLPPYKSSLSGGLTTLVERRTGVACFSGASTSAPLDSSALSGTTGE